MKIHLGCGKRRLQGFVHVDPDEKNKPDHIGMAECIPFDNDSADLLYFCHGLEHIKKEKVQGVITEFRRVLKPGGTLRLSLPDFAIIADLYLNEHVSIMRLGCVNGGQRDGFDVHYAVYDFEHIAILLHQDFYDIRRWDPYDVHPVGFDDYSFAKINGRLISLNVEATCK